jgi:hypothetical protein
MDMNAFFCFTCQSHRQRNEFKISSKSRPTKDETSIVKKELTIFEVKSKRVANLESYYENLNSIAPSSVEIEGIFSGCGRIKLKKITNNCIKMFSKEKYKTS